MPSLIQHIKQFNNNNEALSLLCNSANESIWDWKITLCFYAALHLMHAHLAKFNSHPTRHAEIRNAISPYHFNIKKVSELTYVHYGSLEGLCSMGRYLDNSFAFNGLTKKDFIKALNSYDKILQEYYSRYPNEISGICIPGNYYVEKSLKLINFVKVL